jgi:hypothetical protein
LADKLRMERSGVLLGKPRMNWLRTLYERGPTRVVDLGTINYMDKGYASRTWRSLEADGYIEVVPGDDARSTTVARSEGPHTTSARCQHRPSWRTRSEPGCRRSDVPDAQAARRIVARRMTGAASPHRCIVNLRVRSVPAVHSAEGTRTVHVGRAVVLCVLPLNTSVRRRLSDSGDWGGSPDDERWRQTPPRYTQRRRCHHHGRLHRAAGPTPRRPGRGTAETGMAHGTSCAMTEAGGTTRYGESLEATPTHRSRWRSLR